MSARDVERELRSIAHPGKAADLSRYFKTGAGQYGEGDIFLGITVPRQRKIAERFRDLPLAEIEKLLRSPIHECRLTALEIAVMRYESARASARAAKSDDPAFIERSIKGELAAFYMKNMGWINNWDLVDASAPYILGDYLARYGGKRGRAPGIDRGILLRLARSESVWERRIAIVATSAFIREGSFGYTLKLAKLLLRDSHDLIHKAAGWMLREVGKRDETALTRFLDEHAGVMPRTMLRYSIERLSKEDRNAYLGVKLARKK